MQNQHFAVLHAESAQRIMEFSRIFLTERRFFAFKRAVNLRLLCFVALVVTADAIDGNAVGDCV